MRWTTIVLAATLAVGVAPAVAGTGGDGATRKREAGEAWLRERAEIARRLPSVLGKDDDSLEVWGDDARLVDAGDLDGDGKSDVIDLRTRMEWDDALGVFETLRMDAYRGTDGAALWTRTLPPAYFTFPFATKVGVDGKPGVLVLVYNGAGTGSPVGGAGAGDLTVLSFDRTGAPVWVRPLSGAGGATIATYTDGSSAVAGFFDAVAGGGTDVLVQTTASAEGGDPTGTVYEAEAATQLSVLDGATGVLRPFGEPLRAEWSPYASAVGDLDGDRLDDALVELDGEDGIALRAVGSASGKTLWTTPEGADVFEDTLPDVTGDGIADLAFRSYSLGSIVVEAGAGAAHSIVMPESRVGVLNGKTGKVAWRKPGSYLAPLGDVDRKRGAEVVTGSPIHGTSTGFTVTAYTGSGKKLWTTTRKLPQSKKNDKGMYSVNSWGVIGDVHGDGVAEIGYAIRVADGKKQRRDEGVVNGRTGRVTLDPKPDMYATHAKFDGRGSDSYLSSAARGVFTFEAWRGDTNTRLWTTAVRAAGDRVRSLPVSLDGDRCDDLAVTLLADESTYTSVVYSGSTGRPLWVLTRTANANGTVGKATVVKNAVHRRGC